jgi:3-oxoadipate enol-lactonase
VTGLPAFSGQGQGATAVLLLHGIGGGQAMWADEASGTARALAAAGYRAVSIDLPGYGASAALGAPTMEMLVDGVAAVIAALHAERVVLLGHSMGGMVAQELMAQGGQAARRIDGLVLACTSAAFGKPDGAWQAQFVAERLAPLDAGLGMAGMAQRLVPAMVAGSARPEALQTSIDIMSRVPEATYRSALRSIAVFDRREALAALRVPTLMLAAEHDRTAPPDVMRRMAARVAGAEFVCLADAGHIANVEQPEAFNAAVIDFLLRHVPA